MVVVVGGLGCKANRACAEGAEEEAARRAQALLIVPG
jgi:hypothetical protein